MPKTNPKPTEPVRFLSRDEVLEIIGVTYPCLWGWVRNGCFPAPRSLGMIGKRGRIGWVQSEVDDWILSRPKRFPKGSKITEVA
jgi:predicted DNA-binding transcriptional regulator AlpA